jgi:hypothetical protein
MNFWPKTHAAWLVLSGQIWLILVGCYLLFGLVMSFIALFSNSEQVVLTGMLGIPAALIISGFLAIPGVALVIAGYLWGRVLR